MCTKAKIIVLLVVPLLLIGYRGFGQAPPPEFPKPSPVNAVGRESEFYKKSWQVLRQSDDLVKHSLFILRQMSPTETADGDYLEAIHVLRRLRTTEAIDVLAKRLLYEPEGSLAKGTFDYFPATFALNAIGYPAVPAMLQVIRDPDRSTLERRIACWVLLNIEAKSDPDTAPDDDAVKAVVLARLARFKFLRGRESSAVEEARMFIEGVVDTEGRWQELPVISGAPRTVTLGESVQEQFTCEPPREHPEATMEFVQTEELDELGLKLDKSGKLTGTPKAPGDYRFTIYARAKWKWLGGEDAERQGGRRFRLVVFSKE